MREFVFDLVYDRGSDPLMDVFIEHPTHGHKRDRKLCD